MLLSKSCKYGLRASVLLAALEHDSYVSIRDLSSELDISFHFLTKIFQKLNAAGLLDSRKGVNGGVKLSIPSDQILFIDIVKAIDGTGLMDTCALGLPGCGKKRPCPMHDQWSTIKSGMLNMMQKVSMADLAFMSDEDWTHLVDQVESKEHSLNSESNP